MSGIISRPASTVAADGSGTIRAKAWKKGDPEPDAWTIEVPQKHANLEGSHGIVWIHAAGTAGLDR